MKRKPSSSASRLSAGDAAPEFTLVGTAGRGLRLSDLRGRKVVLYFYPRDDTPGCTREACGFRDAQSKLRAAGVEVLGVSRDSLESHERFRARYHLPFELLSDPDSAVARAYGAFGEKSMYGKKVIGTIRSTFLIDERGRLQALWSPVRVDGHVEQVLAALEGGPASSEASKRKKTAPRKKAKKAAAKKSARRPVRKASGRRRKG